VWSGLSLRKESIFPTETLGVKKVRFLRVPSYWPVLSNNLELERTLWVRVNAPLVLGWVDSARKNSVGDGTQRRLLVASGSPGVVGRRNALVRSWLHRVRRSAHRRGSSVFFFGSLADGSG